jgi:dihydroorotate dehydrogenase electron transfer subunit
MSKNINIASKSHRNTIFVEDAEVLKHQFYADGQYVLRLRASKCADRAEPGQFVHLQCDPNLPMRRPFSIMQASPSQESIDIFYKILGTGTRLLSKRQQREILNVIGPIGQPFVPHRKRPRPLLLGGGVGMPPMIFLAERLQADKHWRPFVILGSEILFPFKPQPSRIIVPGIPEGVIAAMPLLEDSGVPSRLTSRQDFPGCFNGLITDLARLWLERISTAELAEMEIFACGPHAMLRAVAELAQDFELPCQISLEEYMACAVGGCAGCAVQVQTEQGSAMQRVCVDGPVFEAQAVFPRRISPSG